MFPSIPYLLWSPLSVEAVPRRVNRVVEVVVRGRVAVSVGVSIIHPVINLLTRPIAEGDDLSGRGVDDLAQPSVEEVPRPIKDLLKPLGVGSRGVVHAVYRVAVMLVRMKSAVQARRLQSLPDITSHQVSAEYTIVGE